MCAHPVCLQAVEQLTGMSLHHYQTPQSHGASQLEVISEGDEEGQDSDSEPGISQLLSPCLPCGTTSALPCKLYLAHEPGLFDAQLADGASQISFCQLRSGACPVCAQAALIACSNLLYP